MPKRGCGRNLGGFSTGPIFATRIHNDHPNSRPRQQEKKPHAVIRVGFSTVPGRRFELLKAMPADLQSAPFGRSGNLACTIWCGYLPYYRHPINSQIGTTVGVSRAEKRMYREPPPNAPSNRTSPPGAWCIPQASAGRASRHYSAACPTHGPQHPNGLGRRQVLSHVLLSPESVQ